MNRCWILACAAAAAWGCAKDLPTQVESVELGEPPAVPPVVQPAPLAFVEDALVVEVLDGLGSGGRVVVLRSRWSALRAALRGGDGLAAEAALRSAKNAAEGLASGLEPGAADPIALELLLLALSDAQDALGDDSKP